MTPLEVFQRHTEAIGSGDLELMLSHYASDAVAGDPEGLAAGHDHIRRCYERNLPKFEHLDLKQTVASSGDVVLVNWHGRLNENERLEGSDTFVVRDGLIQVHTFYSTVTRRA